MKSGEAALQRFTRVTDTYVYSDITADRQKTHHPCAIKVVSRQKLTAKLLENLEGEINILKAITHPHIVSLEDCFVSSSLCIVRTTVDTASHRS